MSNGFIQVQQLVKTYGNGAKRVEVLKGLDLAISKAERIAIVGENGSGKTTLVKLLARLYDPQEGRMLFPARRS
jgi:ABC-type bacteriocin/lantibiotic exporter with double-glycine peptidase domain